MIRSILNCLHDETSSLKSSLNKTIHVLTASTVALYESHHNSFAPLMSQDRSSGRTHKERSVAGLIRANSLNSVENNEYITIGCNYFNVSYN